MDAEPIVRIRDLKKNSVNFVLQNVDLAFVPALPSMSSPHLGLTVMAAQIRQLFQESDDGGHTHCW